MKMSAAVFILSLFSMYASADGVAKPISRCGPFTLSSSYDGFMHINGVRPDTQKFTFLKAPDDFNNLMYQWNVPRQDAPAWLAMEYIKRNGKAILNVEAVRSNIDQPRIFGTYDCIKLN